MYKKKCPSNVGEGGVLDKDNAISRATSRVELGEALQQLEKVFISCPGDYPVMGWMRTDRDSPLRTKRDLDFHEMMVCIRQDVEATCTLFGLISQNDKSMEFFEINQEHPSDTIPAEVVWSKIVYTFRTGGFPFPSLSPALLGIRNPVWGILYGES